VSTLTCHTTGCINQDTPVELDITVTDDTTGAVTYVDNVVCGWCQQPITDISPPFTPGAPA
jgi:hypothetical protein